MAFDVLSGSINLAAQLAGVKNLDFSQKMTFPINLAPQYSFTTGTGNSFAAGSSNFGATGIQINSIYLDQIALVASTPQTLDLSALTGAEGSIALSKIKAIGLWNLQSESGRVLTVGGAASNAFDGIFADATDKLKINPCGSLLLIDPGAGYTVDGTHKSLKLDPGASDVACLLMIAGVV